ncbi:MAG: MoaD/ThiS family protein [Deltaproteobacteria bacterium]|jgi:molybdopterin converting factor small subunit|nr:MoaD/ThiS family protein [Deltaproteobacteria bacterium]
MTVRLLVPSALRGFTDGKAELRLEGATVAEVLEGFVSAHPDAKNHMFDEKGALREFINVFAGEDNIRDVGGLETPLKDGETVMIVPAIAGGRDDGLARGRAGGRN